MINNIVNVGKDLANKLSNKFLNLSDIEIKIKDATNDEAWGPSGSLMKEIASDTYSTMNFNDIMTYLWYRIFMEKPVNSRRTYKGLVLLQYLIINGSEYVAVSCREHVYDLRRLDRYVDQNGTSDQNVRKKSQDIVGMLTDPERLSSERERAKLSQNRFYGSGKTAIQSSSIQQMGNFDDWNPDKNQLPFKMIAEGFAELMDNVSKNINGPPPTETHDNFDIPENDVDFSRYVDKHDTYDDLNRHQYSQTRFNKPNIQQQNRATSVTGTNDNNTNNNNNNVINNTNIDNKAHYIPPIPIPTIDGPSRQLSGNKSIPNNQMPPIIDFTECKQSSIPINNSGNDLLNILDVKTEAGFTNNNDINNNSSKGEFTGFVGWDNKSENKGVFQQLTIQPDLLMSTITQPSIQSVSSASSNACKETWPGVAAEPVIDFDLLAQSRVTLKQSSGIVLNQQPPIMQPVLFNSSPQATNIAITNNSNTHNNKENQSDNNVNKAKTWVGMDLNSLGIDLDNLCNSNNPNNNSVSTNKNPSFNHGKNINQSNPGTKDWGFHS